MPSAISWNAASPNSSSSAASPPASKKPPEITEPSSLSLRSSYGCDKCPHRLALQLRFLLEMSSTRIGLMSPTPRRPCEDVCVRDASLGKLYGDVPDLLD